MITLDKDFWNNKYENHETGWDLGIVSPPIKEYLDQCKNKDINILIPGAGNAYEAEYLFNQGFRNVTVIDIAPRALKALQTRVPDFPKENLVEGDFFGHQGSYDLIIEQTFFCAIDPALRQAYAAKMKSLLKNGGKLMGVLFQIPLNDNHPPFGGNKAEYTNYFEGLFQISIMETCYNSAKPRADNELFILLENK
jgi:methyl halide transferase